MAGELGFDVVEPNLGGAVSRDRREAETELVRSYCSEHDLILDVHLPWVEIHLGSPREHVREGALRELRSYVDLAARMGARGGVVHVSSAVTDYPGWDRERIFSLLVDSVDSLDSYARDRGIDLRVENKQTFLSAPDVAELLAETDVSMTFDTGHANVSGMSSAEMADFVATYRDRISEIHLNDTRGARDEHLPLGAGELDVPGILSPIVNTGWDGTVLLDLSVFDYEYVEVSKRRLDEVLGGE